MSEGLQSKYLKDGKIVGQKIIEFEYFNIGDVTFNQLQKAKIIPNSFSKDFNSHKPDRLIVDRRNKTPVVIAVIEDKKSGKFNNENDKIQAIRQCNNYCQELQAKIGIITDNSTTIWINPNESDPNNSYLDNVTNKERSFSFILKPDQSNLITDFLISNQADILSVSDFDEQTQKTYKIIKDVVSKINKSNSVLKEIKRIDPLPLAKRVWQDIWVATGNTPEKCLYNVVELFIFKFLSDLGVLKDPDSFEFLEKLYKTKDDQYVLDYYAKICRKKIKSLFPSSPVDGTTIINGTIFVNEYGEPNLTQALLFHNSIKKFKEFEDEYGAFTSIDKNFKTKLYESFLKQSAGLKTLGQYFTPRKIVQAIVKISDIDKLTNGQIFCDPFCGVGGFILEPINLYDSRMNDFIPKNSHIIPKIKYIGYDKGFERDEERTIILAKANMLIYLAEIISQNPTLTSVFATEVFNNTFKLWKSNLGTLENIIQQEEDKFDLILTNPPYVTSGSKAIKNEIQKKTELENFYAVNGTGVEGLALEWIIRSLKINGKAFIIIPDGLLNRIHDKKLREFILKECYLEAIISLPLNTFFATPKKTYILIITKKDKEITQSHGVFTYLVSNIGETLDINRFDIEQNDLNEVIDLYNQYKGIKNNSKSKDLMEGQSNRCKIQNIERFYEDVGHHWQVDRWWSKEEKIVLGIEEEIEALTVDEFSDKLDEIKLFIDEKKTILSSLKKKSYNITFKEFSINQLFRVIQGNSKYTRNYGQIHKGEYPVYSASDDVPLTHIDDYEYDGEYLTWIRTGFAGNMKTISGKFSINIDRGILIPKTAGINLNYIKILLEPLLRNLARGRRPDKGNNEFTKVYPSFLENQVVLMPINEDGSFNSDIQAELIKENMIISNILSEISKLKAEIELTLIDFEDSEYNLTEIPLIDIFETQKGNPKYTQEYFSKHPGSYPVYSSQTQNEGIASLIDSYDYDSECLTWTTDGANAGTIFYINGKFSMTTHCGALFLKDDYKNKVHLPYIRQILSILLKENRFGDMNRRLTINLIEKIYLKLPIKNSKELDYDLQVELANKYDIIEQLKIELCEELSNLTTYSITI